MAEKVVRYRFIASGHDAVISAYRGVTAAAQQAAASGASVAARTGRAASQVRAGVTARQRAEEKWRLSSDVDRVVAKAAEKHAKIEQKAKEKSLAHVAKIKDRYFSDEQRKQERADRKAARMAEQRAKAVARAREKSRDEWIHKPVSSLGAGIFDRSVTAAKTAGMATLATVGAAARESFQTREIANRVSINAGLTGEKVSRDDLQRRFEYVANSTPGMKAQDVGQAALEYQGKTGKVLGQGELQSMATAASAFGADIKDIAQAAAAVGKKFDIQGPAGISEALAIIGQQGAQGSFEIKDAASQYDRLTAAAGSFGIGKGVGAVSRLGGFTQIAREATGSSEEAVTSIENVFTKLQDPNVQKKLSAAGVKLFDKEGKARDLPTLLPEIVEKVGGKNIVKKKGELADLFDARGIRALRPLIQAYADATQSGKDGVKAMTDKISEASNTTDALARMNEAAAIAQTDSSAQLQSAWEALKSQTTEALTPALAEMVPHLVSMVPALQSTVEGLGTFFETLGNLVKFLQDKGIIDKSAQATKTVHSEAERKKIEQQIHELEASPARSQKQEAELARMKETLGSSSVSVPTMPSAASPHAPLTGLDAIENVMRMKDPAAEAASQGGWSSMGGTAGKASIDIDTVEANKKLVDVAGAAQQAADALRKIEESRPAGLINIGG